MRAVASGATEVDPLMVMTGFAAAVPGIAIAPARAATTTQAPRRRMRDMKTPLTGSFPRQSLLARPGRCDPLVLAPGRGRDRPSAMCRESSFHARGGP